MGGGTDQGQWEHSCQESADLLARGKENPILITGKPSGSQVQKLRNVTRKGFSFPKFTYPIAPTLPLPLEVEGVARTWCCTEDSTEKGRGSQRSWFLSSLLLRRGSVLQTQNPLLTGHPVIYPMEQRVGNFLSELSWYIRMWLISNMTGILVPWLLIFYF